MRIDIIYNAHDKFTLLIILKWATLILKLQNAQFLHR